MFGSFKKWIQTTVDTTTNSVLSFNPLTALEETLNSTNTVNNGNAYNPSYQNTSNKPIQQQQLNKGLNSSNVNVSLSFNESIKVYKNNNQDSSSNVNKIVSSNNSQFKSFNQIPPSSLSIQNRKPEHSSKTQPSTPNLESSSSFFSNSFSIPKSASVQNQADQEPDLSHLSKEEQAHIALVLQRAKVDEIESTTQEINNNIPKQKITINNNDDKNNSNSNDLSIKNQQIEPKIIKRNIENDDSNRYKNEYNDEHLKSKRTNGAKNTMNEDYSNIKQNIDINNNSNDKCEICNNINNNSAISKLYICDKCGKMCCINCRIIIKKKLSAVDSMATEKCQILCKNCSKNQDKLNNNNNKNINQSIPPSIALLATKKEIVNALISKAQNQNPVTTTISTVQQVVPVATTTNYKSNKLTKLSNCDEFYPNTENIPYNHHYNHRRKVEEDNCEVDDDGAVSEEKLKNINNNVKSYQNCDNFNNTELYVDTIPQNTSYSNIDDETSFIIYAEKEIANLERTIKLKNIENKQQVQTTNFSNNSSNEANKIQIKEIYDSQLTNETDSDTDYNEEIVYNKDAKVDRIKTIAPASKFSDEFKQMSERRTKEKDIEIKAIKQIDSLETKKIKRKLPPPPVETLVTETNKKSAEIFFEEKQKIKNNEQLVVNPKLENVTEWLNRSFDRQKNVNNNNNNRIEPKVQLITLTEPKNKLLQRQNSDDSENYLKTNDEDIIEINLSNSKLKAKQELNVKQGPTITLIDPRDKIYSNDTIDTKNTKVSTTDLSICKTYLYKDPKDKTDSLGIKITAQQKVFDTITDLVALVTAIAPDGLVQRFDVPIRIGDEIMEINGVTLRNKSDEQIKNILNTCYDFNNGEIEIISRKIEKSKFTKPQSSFTGEDSLNKTFEQIDELQSIVSSIGTLDPARSSPSIRSSITSSPVSSEIMMTNLNQRLSKADLLSKRNGSDEYRILQQQKSRSTTIINNEDLVKRTTRPKSQQQEATYISNRQPDQNAPLLKISAPPESDENLSYYSSGSLQYNQEKNVTPIKSKNSIKDNQQQLDQSQSAFFLTTQKKAPERSGSKKSTSSNKENTYLDSLSSTTSVDDMRSSQASSQRTLVVNDDQSNKSFTSLNLQSTEVIKVASDVAHDEINSKKDIPKTSNTLKITGKETSTKNILVSSSMSSIISSHKLSSDSISADVDSDNFSKYFPSSRENSPRESSLDVNSENPKKQSSKSNITKNQGKDDKNKDKGKSPFKFPKRSSSLLNRKSKNSENIDDRKDSSAKNPLKPFGEIQIQMSHSEKDEQINVKIIKARNLLAKDANGYSDPFVKIYLLPGRDQDNKRRTKPVFKNLNPEWNYQVSYPNVHKEEVKYKTLEVTVWDYDRFKSNDFLGKISIELNDSKLLDDKPRWYSLKDLNDGINDTVHSKTIENHLRKSQK